MTNAAIPILSSIGALASPGDAWIVDIWGVMHNGVRAYEAACAACRRMRSAGGTVVLLSNAPRPFTDVMTHLDGLGVPRDAYDLGVTSGDVTRSLIADLARSGHRAPLLHIGPERDKGLFADLDVALVPAEQAEVVICSGFYDDTKETPADYAPLLERLRARNLPMVCANPDIKVERGDKLVYCAGALAAAYEALGGRVTYAGKPHVPVYERAFAEIARHRGGPVTRDRILAIGDGIETDLKGAHAAGIASVFIASAVHVPGPLDQATLASLFAGRPFAPLAALPALAW